MKSNNGSTCLGSFDLNYYNFLFLFVGYYSLDISIGESSFIQRKRTADILREQQPILSMGFLIPRFKLTQVIHLLTLKFFHY